MTEWLLIVGAVLVAAGLAFVFWPAAVIFAGGVLIADGIFDLHGEGERS